MIALLTTFLCLAQDKDPALEELRTAWTRMMDLASSEKAEEMSRTVSGWKLTREEFVRLFGEEKTKRAYPDYEKFWKGVDDKLVGTILMLVKERKYNTVDVWRLNATEAKDLSDYEKSTLESLADKQVKLYGLRLRKKESKDGYKFSCFVKIGDHWRAGFKVGTWLKPEK